MVWPVTCFNCFSQESSLVDLIFASSDRSLAHQRGRQSGTSVRGACDAKTKSDLRTSSVRPAMCFQICAQARSFRHHRTYCSALPIPFPSAAIWNATRAHPHSMPRVWIAGYGDQFT